MPGPLLPPPTPPGGQLPPAPPPQFPPSPRRRRGSIFSGLLLVIVGILLLVARLHSGLSLGYVITHFWPVIIIVWGISRLIDRYALPHGTAPGGMVTGGEIALIVGLVALVCVVAMAMSVGGWVNGRFRPSDFGAFAEHYSETKRIDVKHVDAPNSIFAIDTQTGAINVHAGNDNGLLVVGTASAAGDSEQAAQNRMKNLDLTFDGNAGNYQIHPVNANGGVSVDLDVELPKAASVSARSQHGDVSIAGTQGATDAATRNGDLQIHDVGSNVTADVQNGGAHIRAVGGAVNFTGRGGGDVEIADVQRDVTIGGNVFGDVDVRDAAKGVHYSSPRGTELQIAGLAGELKIDNSDITLSRAMGPINISSRNHDMRLDGVEGQLDLTETRGDINVTLTAPPKAPINITDDAGDVTLTLPPQSTFTISAQSQSGDIDDDFGSNSEDSDGQGFHHLDHTYGTGGPMIHITTRYGTIHIGKGS